MKKITFLTLAIMLTFCGFSQNRAILQKELRDKSSITPAPVLETTNFSKKTIKSKDSKLSANTISTTYYDLQTNTSMQSRMYLYPDGFIGGVFTYGINYPNFPERGTGYNSFDGANWGSYPTQRIENDRTGWPSYSPWGQTGELVVAHTSNYTLAISKRTTKGTGSWTSGILGPPTGANGHLWARSATGGFDNSTLHIISITTPTGNGGSIYQGQDGALLYSRSPDGGQTWDLENVLISEINSSYYTGFTADIYEIIAQDNNVAILAGDDWTDLVLLKSSDNGFTWVKTIIWDHPYPLFDRNNPIVTGTFYCTDGAHNLAFDNTGKVHVAFGINRARSDNGLFWFANVGGIGYWNEDMPVFSNDLNALNPYGHPDSELMEDYNLIGWSQDVNGNGVLDVLDDFGTYYLGFSSMPQLVIDEMNNVYLVYSSVTESYDNGIQNYRHLWARGSNDNGQTWGDFVDLNSDLVYQLSECVYPSCSPTSDGNIHLIYQRDYEPGLAIKGDQDPYGENIIEYMSIAKGDIVPSYCPITYSNQTDDWISNVTFNSIDNTSGTETNGYADYTAFSTDVEQSSNYDISVDVVVNGDWVQNTWAWIDWNQDLDFTDPGEAYDLGETPGTQGTFTLSANITIPPDAMIGSTRMRVAESYNIDPEPCTQSTYGEAEDYTIDVIESPFLSPTDLIAEVNENNVRLSWTNSNPQWIQWDDGINAGNGIGLTGGGGGTFYAASHWMPTDLVDYDGMSVTQLSFFPNDDLDATFVLKVWTGANAETEVMSQDIAVFTVDDFNIVNLDNPVTIDVSMEYWFGYEVTHGEGTHPAGVDAGPAVQEFGDMFSFDGISWTGISAAYGLDYNWNIAVYVDVLKNAAPPKAIVKSTTPISNGTLVESVATDILKIFNPPVPKNLTEYNIYRDGLLIDNTSSTTYTDTGLASGTFEYFVTTVYDAGESGASNTVTVEIEDVYNFDIKIFLEGPFLSNQMIPFLNFQGYIPLEQPYNTEPWNYWGNESVAAIPNSNIVDWILLEMRESTGDVSTAIVDSTIAMVAAFLLKDGTIVSLDGISPIRLFAPSSSNLYAVVWHRNHLGVISNYPLIENDGVYNYDFTTSANQAYQGQYVMKELNMGIWGTMSGNGLNDAQINNDDKNEVWVQDLNSLGYLEGDFDMSGTVNTSDKEVYWKPNSGKGGMVPGGPVINWGFTCGDSIKDSRDGQKYATVQIGTQCWMAENLNIGTVINDNNDQLDNNIIEKYCFFNDVDNCDTLGGLYQWKEMMQYVFTEGASGICPSDWHLPSDTEWCILEQEVDPTITCESMDFRGIDGGGKLKKDGTEIWNSPNTGATNSSGFSALPGGYRDLLGVPQGYHSQASFWSSNWNYNYPFYRKLTSTKSQIFRGQINKDLGYSVRCIKNLD